MKFILLLFISFSLFFLTACKNKKEEQIVLDSKDFIFEKDRIIDYYIETGISFQNRELLLHVISTKTREFEYDENISNIHPDVKEARNNDDFLYGILSKKIYSQMKVIKRHHNELPLYL